MEKKQIPKLPKIAHPMSQDMEASEAFARVTSALISISHISVHVYSKWQVQICFMNSEIKESVKHVLSRHDHFEDFTHSPCSKLIILHSYVA
jgi:hypothetical protein